ncbi:amidohydrolase family protein [bacterium]|nr:amidohydrolase family protein [bacterium]
MRILPLFCFVIALFSGVAHTDASDEIPGVPQTQPIALTGGTVFPISQPPIENGVVLFDKGRIVAVGTAESVEIPVEAKQVDCNGKHVYPGLFEAHSQLGLTEVSAVRASDDRSEVGSLNPNVKAHVSVNPDSELIPVTRVNGVLLALTEPSSGLIAGQAAVLQLDGWTCEDLTLKPGAAMVVNWPSVPKELEKGQTATESDAVARLRKLLGEARAYTEARKQSPETQPTDLRLEALQPVLSRKVPLLVHADSLAVIQSAVSFAVEQKLRLIIHGGYDAPLCAELLKKHDVPVIIGAAYRLPRRRSDDFDAGYSLASRLHEAGIRFCISGGETSRTWNARNLPYHAAVSVAYGLPHDIALRAITLSPAEILGVSKRVGSLEPGKDATLIVTTGDPLETASNVTAAWVQGRTVDLSSRHVQLYRKYRKKYEQLRESK